MVLICFGKESAIVERNWIKEDEKRDELALGVWGHK